MTVHGAGDGSLPNDPVDRGSRPVVGVCAPVYNEASGIAATVRGWSETLRRYGVPFEIVLCDDGSGDGTFEALSALGEVPELRVSRHASNRGAGAALRTAIAHSRADWLITIDSDGQFALEDGLRMLDETRDAKALACIGHRQKQDRALLVLGSRFTSWLACRVYRADVKDFNCALKVVHGEECRAMRLRATRFDGSTEITSRILLMGLPMIQTPVAHHPRREGQSKIRMFDDGMARIQFVGYLRAEARLIRRGSMDLGELPGNAGAPSAPYATEESANE